MAVVKDSLNIGSNQKLLHDGSAGDGIFDVVADQCAIVAPLEGVFVNPHRVGAFGLPVDETARWFPDGDLALPANRYAANAQPIVQQSSLLYFARRRRQNFKVEPCRREAIEIAGVGEEYEYFGGWLRQPNCFSKPVGFHDSYC